MEPALDERGDLLLLRHDTAPQMPRQ